MKRVVLLQNTDLGAHHALSSFLTSLLSYYKKDNNFTFDVICGSVAHEDQIQNLKKNLTIHVVHTAYNKIIDNFLYAWRSFRVLLGLRKSASIDILHCLYPNSSLLAAVMYKIFIDRKVKIIYDIRSPWIEMSFANKWISSKKKRIKTLMHVSEKVLVKFVDYFVFITAGTKNYYEKKYALKFKNNVSIIPTGVDVEKFSKPVSDEYKNKLRSDLGITNNDIVIGYVGTISQMREMSTFLSTQIDFIQSHPVKFLMIGDGDDASNITTLFAQHNLSDKLLMMGKMKQSDLIPYMHIFDYGRCHLPDIFVFRNSFPLKILEYLAVGIPVLASDIEAHRYIQRQFGTNIAIYTIKNFSKRLIPQQNASFNTNDSRKFDRILLTNIYIAIYDNL